MISGGRWRRPGVFIVNFNHISYLVLVFLLLTLNMQYFENLFSLKVHRDSILFLKFFESKVLLQI